LTYRALYVLEPLLFYVPYIYLSINFSRFIHAIVVLKTIIDLSINYHYYDK